MPGNHYIFGKEFHDKWLSARPMSEEEKRRHRLKREKMEDSSMSLHNTEGLFRQFMRNPGYVVIDDGEARAIFEKFTGRELALRSLDRSHVAFLQAALMSAIDASFAMGFIEVIFRTVLYRPVIDGNSFGRVLRKLARGTAKHLLRNAADRDIMDAEIYQTIITAIVYQCGTYFREIEQGQKL